MLPDVSDAQLGNRMSVLADCDIQSKINVPSFLLPVTLVLVYTFFIRYRTAIVPGNGRDRRVVVQSCLMFSVRFVISQRRKLETPASDSCQSWRRKGVICCKPFKSQVESSSERENVACHSFDQTGKHLRRLCLRCSNAVI